MLEAFGADTPVDVEALAERLGYPVRWRILRRDQRGGLEGDPDNRVLVLNREYPFRGEGERRWAIAEELGHAVLGHTALVASDEPGGAVVVSEPTRVAQERDAKSFAAELLMPAAPSGAIASRAEAYRRLAEAANVIERLEPHSPIPYLVRRAVELGSMPFPLLMRALIRDSSVLHEMNRELGIKDESES